MSWTPNEREIQTVLALEASKRYEHWVKKVAAWQEVWGLWQEGGWASAGDDTGRELIPVWPHSAYAAVCAEGSWSGYIPKVIPLDDWLNRWIPGMERDKLLVAVFPTPQGKGVPIEPRRLEQDLRNELSNYE